jgi:hypothetical protein
MGCPRNVVAGGSNIGLTTQQKIIASIPPNVQEGQQTYIKISTGDIVYIGFKGKKASAADYDVILTDSVPFFSEDGIVIGDITAVGSAATSVVSAYISMKVC